VFCLGRQGEASGRSITKNKNGGVRRPRNVSSKVEVNNSTYCT